MVIPNYQFKFLDSDSFIDYDETISDSSDKERITEAIINIETIGDQAFRDYTALVSVTISDSVTSIGEQAFRGCTALVSVTISDSVTSIGYGLFQGCTALESVTIGERLVEITWGVFYGCEALKSITIPGSVEIIRGSVFRDCKSLKSITIPDTVEIIEGGVFENCNALESVTIGKKVTHIGISAFKDCTSLKSVTIPDSVTNDPTNTTNTTKTHYHMFQNCTALRSAIIGNGLKKIHNTMFWNCTALQSVIIGNNVETIGYNAFKDCTALTSVTIPDSVTTIFPTAFIFSGLANDGAAIYMNEGNTIYTNEDNDLLEIQSDNDGNVSTQLLIGDFYTPESVDIVYTNAVITLVGPSEVTLEKGAVYTDAGATAAYATGKNITSAIQTASTVDVNTVGDYTVTYDLQNANAEPKIRFVTVQEEQDTTAPVITVTGDNPATVEKGSTYTDAGATASDDNYGDITANIETNNPVVVDVPGTYTVTYNVSDVAGNAASPVTRTVTVIEDTTAPVITLVGDSRIVMTQGEVYNDFGASADGGEEITVGGDTVDTNTTGTYTVTYSATDAAGNPATESRTVVVTQKLVSLTYKIRGVDLDDLSATIKANIVTRVKAAYASFYTRIGYDIRAEKISITLTQGSVNVKLDFDLNDLNDLKTELSGGIDNIYDNLSTQLSNDITFDTALLEIVKDESDLTSLVIDEPVLQEPVPVPATLTVEPITKTTQEDTAIAINLLATFTPAFP